MLFVPNDRAQISTDEEKSDSGNNENIEWMCELELHHIIV